MGEFRYIPPDEVAQRHRASRPESLPRQNGKGKTHSEQKNVEVVLSLGDVRYIHFGPHVYAIPPVPFKLGQRVLDVHIKTLAHARQVALTGDKAPTDAYYKELAKLARLLWTHVRPTGKVKRFFWRLGLLRNPFRVASEMEMKAITDFFLQGRMTSSVRSISETEAQA